MNKRDEVLSFISRSNEALEMKGKLGRPLTRVELESLANKDSWIRKEDK